MYADTWEDRPSVQLLPHDRRLTHDDFLLFPDDGRRHELIDGVHYVTPSPVPRVAASDRRVVPDRRRAFPGSG